MSGAAGRGQRPLLVGRRCTGRPAAARPKSAQHAQHVVRSHVAVVCRCAHVRPRVQEAADERVQQAVHEPRHAWAQVLQCSARAGAGGRGQSGLSAASCPGQVGGPRCSLAAPGRRHNRVPARPAATPVPTTQRQRAGARRRTGTDSAGLGVFRANSRSIANDHLPSMRAEEGHRRRPRRGRAGRQQQQRWEFRLHSLVPAVPVGRVQRNVEIALDPGRQVVVQRRRCEGSDAPLVDAQGASALQQR